MFNYRECFANEHLGTNPNGLAATGHNSGIFDFKDPSKHQVSHKYGSSSIIKNHPCLEVI